MAPLPVYDEDEVGHRLEATSAAAVERAIDEAFVSGYRVVMLVAAATALASALSTALLIGGKREPEERPEAETARALAA